MAKVVINGVVLNSAKELREYCEMLFGTNVALQRQVSSLEGEVRHLQGLLASMVPIVESPTVETILVSDDQAICEIQIQKLKEDAFARPLSLDETKKLDLLMKNLYMAKKHNSQVVEAQSKKLPESISHTELMQLATSKEAEHDGQES